MMQNDAQQKDIKDIKQSNAPQNDNQRKVTDRI